MTNITINNTKSGCNVLLSNSGRIAEGGLRLQGVKKSGSLYLPLVTIVTVVYNAASQLEETIKSVMGQKYVPVEYVIIDGGSTDGTLDIIRKYEAVIDYWVSEKDNGIYHAMNKGLKVFNGSYVNFLNAGDSFCDADVLKKLFNNVGAKSDIVYGDHIAVDGNKMSYKKSGLFSVGNLIKNGTKVINHQSMFVNRRVVMNYTEDYELKGELKWYFDMLGAFPSMDVRRESIPVVLYDKHGLSEQKKLLNLKEFVQVVYIVAGVKGVIQSYWVILKSIVQILIR